MWTAFETLIRNDDEVGIVDGIVENLWPFLSLNYFKKTFRYVNKILSANLEKHHQKIVNKSGCEHLVKAHEKCACLLMCGSDELFSELDELTKPYPLVNYRINRVRRDYRKKGVRLVVERHKRKINWQLRRIYRARKLSVHAGLELPFNNILIENSHYYLDVLLEGVTEFVNVETKNRPGFGNC